MYGTLLSGLALFGAAFALPIDNNSVEAFESADAVAGTIGYLPVNSGWLTFPFGPTNSTTPIMFNLFCPGQLNITDLYCSGDRFAIYDNGVFVRNTSVPVFNNCSSNSTDPNFTQRSANWSHASIDLLPGWHNISIVVITAPYGGGFGAIRVDTEGRDDHDDHDRDHHDRDHRDRDHRRSHSKCSIKTCPVCKGDLVVVNTPVPRCQADSVCRSLGMHLAHIDISNFMDATTLAFQCSGAFSQTWVDDWNGDDYAGTCLVLSTGGAAPGGAINVPSCCSTRLPVMCQKKPCAHKPVHYSCNSCQESCYCKDKNSCKSCSKGECKPCKSCGLLMDY